MIRRIRINGYKSLRDFSAELAPLSVVFGPNAAGKSNFLDALQLLSKMASSKTLKHAFDPPYRGRPLESFTFPPEGIEGTFSASAISFSISVDIELSGTLIKKVDSEIVGMRKGLEAKTNGKLREHFVEEKLIRYDLEIELLPERGYLRVKNVAHPPTHAE